MKKTQLTITALLLLATQQAAAFPEIPFCPLGGPPGWFNRLFDDDDHRYPPPWWYGRRHAPAAYGQHPGLPMLQQLQPAVNRKAGPCNGK